MTVVTEYLANAFYWPGMCSGNAEACKRFYTGLLGWDAVDMMMPGGSFTSFQIGGTIVAGMYQMPDERKAAGLRPHWNSYMHVNDLDQIVKSVPEAGGKVLLGPFDADDKMMANLEDPSGAKFSVWQETTGKQDPTLFGEPGALCWSELVTPDVAVSKEFYSKIFGWKPVPFEGGPVPYTVFEPGDGRDATAGMFEMTPEMKGMPAQWLPYFLVKDADEAAAKVRELGGKVEGEIMDVAGVGRIGMISDAEGAGFAVLEPARGQAQGQG